MTKAEYEATVQALLPEVLAGAIGVDEAMAILWGLLKEVAE